MFITFLYLILILRSDKKLRSFLLRVAWYIYTILTQHSRMFPVLLSLVELFTSDSLLTALIFCETNCEVAFMMLLTWYVSFFWIHYIGLKEYPFLKSTQEWRHFLVSKFSLEFPLLSQNFAKNFLCKLP